MAVWEVDAGEIGDDAEQLVGRPEWLVLVHFDLETCALVCASDAVGGPALALDDVHCEVVVHVVVGEESEVHPCCP